jgi:hypothetical protein
MMNVPVIGLSSVLQKANGEWNGNRGKIVDSIDDMVDQIPEFIAGSKSLTPREWVVERYGMKAAYDRLQRLLKDVNNDDRSS